MGTSKDARAFEPLAGLLGDPDRFLRQEAAQALGNLGDARAVEPLKDLLEDPHVWVRVVAIGALSKVDPRFEGSLAQRMAVPAILEALEHGEPFVRMQAAASCGHQGAVHFVEPLLAVLKEDSLAQFAAVISLGKIGDPRAIPPLRELLPQAAERPGLFGNILDALILIGGPDPGDLIDQLGGLLRHPNADSASMAAGGLRVIGDFRAFDALWWVLQDAAAPQQVRNSASKALQGFRDPRIAEPMIEALQHKEKFVRWAAANILEATCSAWAKDRPLANRALRALDHVPGTLFDSNFQSAVSHAGLQIQQWSE